MCEFNLDLRHLEPAISWTVIYRGTLHNYTVSRTDEWDSWIERYINFLSVQLRFLWSPHWHWVVRSYRMFWLVEVWLRRCTSPVQNCCDEPNFYYNFWRFMFLSTLIRWSGQYDLLSGRNGTDSDSKEVVWVWLATGLITIKLNFSALPVGVCIIANQQHLARPVIAVCVRGVIRETRWQDGMWIKLTLWMILESIDWCLHSPRITAGVSANKQRLISCIIP